VYGPNTFFTSTRKDGACLTKGAYVHKLDLDQHTNREYVPTLYIVAAATAPPISAMPRKYPWMRSRAAPPVCVGAGAGAPVGVSCTVMVVEWPDSMKAVEAVRALPYPRLILQYGSLQPISPVVSPGDSMHTTVPFSEKWQSSDPWTRSEKEIRVTSPYNSGTYVFPRPLERSRQCHGQVDGHSRLRVGDVSRGVRMDEHADRDDH
jgi:hypothetical protein